jgi:ATP-binding protein involved in chromosome partitioning
MDEATVRAAFDGATSVTGEDLLDADEIGDVIVEGETAIVVLRREAMPRDLLARIHAHAAARLPGMTLELRPAGQVYRGGAGWGDGRHVIAVVGGKGGVGKSTIAVNLALTLTAMGLRCGLLDGDLSAPDIPHMLGVHFSDPNKPAAVPSGFTSRFEPGARRVHRGTGWSLFSERPLLPSRRAVPETVYSTEVMSVGFVVPERLPPSITGRVYVAALLRYLLFDVAWTADVLLIDAPPGTGEEIQIMARELPLSGAVFVTTPQDLAQMDAERTLTYLRDHDVPVLGLVQNMAQLTCPHCEREIDLFAASTRLTEAGVSVLGRIPFDTRLAVTADRGLPLVLGDPRGPIAYEFARIGAAVRRRMGAG